MIRDIKTSLRNIYDKIEEIQRDGGGSSGEGDAIGTALKKTKLSVGIATLADLANLEENLETTLSNKLDLSSKNFLDYATLTALTLEPEIDVYKITLTADGVSADFPLVDVANIPTRDSYFKFEIEATVPTGVTTITYPSCYVWLNEDDIPETGLIEGKTVCFAARFDCATDRSNLSGSTLINPWRIK